MINSYKEKCIILEHSNEMFQKKILKLEENFLGSGLKSEMVLMNKELSKEIEKNQNLTLLNNKLQDEKVYLQNEIEELNEKLTNAQNSYKNSGLYEDYKFKEYENNNKFLESLLEKQQSELEDKRQQIEILKQNILKLEEDAFLLKKKTQKAEVFISDVTEVNEKLLKALKKKNRCRHRALTPDAFIKDYPKYSHSSTFSNPINQNKLYNKNV